MNQKKVKVPPIDEFLKRLLILHKAHEENEFTGRVKYTLHYRQGLIRLISSSVSNDRRYDLDGQYLEDLVETS